MSKLVEKFTQLVNEAGEKGLQCAVFLRSGVQMPGFVFDAGGTFRVRTSIQGPDKREQNIDAFFPPEELVFFQVPVQEHIIRPVSPIKFV